VLWSAIVEDLDAFYVVASNVAIALMLKLGGALICGGGDD
jgi:hypothetical protein